MSKVARLEQMLRLWEDICYLRRTRSQVLEMQRKPTPYPLVGPLAHWFDFRRDLLAAGIDGDIDPGKFFCDPTDPVQLAQLMKSVGKLRLSIPTEIASWSVQSRRIYSPSLDLQALLNAMSLKDLTWADISWPFGSFAITLESPIKDRHGNDFDCILVNRYVGPDPQGEEQEVTQIRLLGPSIEKSLVSDFDRAQINKSRKQMKWHDLEKQLKAAETKLGRAATAIFSLNGKKIGNSLVSDSALDLMFKSHGQQCGCGGTHEDWDQAIHIVVGLCMYLRSLPADSPHRTPWRNPTVAEGATNKSIIGTAEVCAVQSKHRLSDEERKVFLGHRRGTTGAQMSAHFREGHWRRPPGKGNNPTAEKTVEVLPTIVRRDRLGPGETVPGMEKVM